MTNLTFDPKTIMDAYTEAFSTAINAQKESLQFVERAGRYQHALAGDCLDWSLSVMKAALAAQTPTDFVSKQVDLAGSGGEKLRVRMQELAKLATDVQSTISKTVTEASAKVAQSTKKAA